MTVAPSRPRASEPAQPAAPDLITLTIDGLSVSVPKGTLIIRAAELLGIEIPRFCDHPLLDPVGACRQCIVEVEGQRKPVASCTTTVAADMVVKTQLTSPVARKAQAGTLEFLLLNHPLDCPICDKGGECPLQNQSMANGGAVSRFKETKRVYPKPLAISTEILLDRERCVLCARCTRFSAQIAGDPFIELFERGAAEQVAVSDGQPFSSYFSGNTVQICPVGALTSAAYRFRARPFDLVSTPTACEHCASGCSLRTDHRRGRVTRRLAGDDPAVNEEWNCDKGRFAFTYARAADRLTTPLIRDDDTGQLVPVSWSEALKYAARGLAECRDRRGVGVLTGGRLTREDAYAYAKFTRVALASNDVDFRARPHSAEEEQFLGYAVAGTGIGVTYADLEAAPAVLLVAFEPEEESPIVFLRLRKAVDKHAAAVHALAPLASRGLTKLAGTLVPTRPGEEAAVLDALAAPDRGGPEAPTTRALRAPGAVILVGERAAEFPGALSAAVRLAEATGASLAWVPRRAGDRGAVSAGLLPSLLPGGRPVTDAAGRAEVEEVWGGPLPGAPGRDTDGMLAAAAAGRLDGMIVAGVDAEDLPNPASALATLARMPFCVSIELRRSSIAEVADVVLPIAPVAEKAGSFVDWEGRLRPFQRALDTPALPDVRVLHLLAAEMGLDLGLPDAGAAARELRALGRAGDGVSRVPAPSEPIAEPPVAGVGEAVLATWHQLVDDGALQADEPYLAGTARPAVARLSAATAAEIGAVAGRRVTITASRGSITLPVEVTAMPDRVVWVPTHSPGSHVRRALAGDAGVLVRVGPAEDDPPAEDGTPAGDDTPGGRA
ncbi:NADH-quinone oxidoreductase subunit G [Frankia sp. CcI156]|nr:MULTISPECIES: NADH-quinone oxidoreductase subunit G [unclassified Frankia]ETA04363.1 NADH dehydrogenase subunit G [Frankia sp. CcI6]KDA44939.1 NADH dehydrogenase subunit G [Frankia sp. BMG5.23]KFB06590.1 NADH dehydrogenase subunit G [Frankia sp. Allo2]OHV50787.1 NADH-quinone oxidoreductase subunit G [Frankia sp. CgIS1]ONH30035.1 NADH-quinone oxidoreductase subunit G [Frankia sp. CcI156]